MTMASLADMLTPFVDRPVIDGTSLKAPYQVSLDLPFDAMMRVIQNLSGTAGMPAGFAGLGGFGPWPGAGGAGAVPDTASDPAGLSIFQSLHQLGLKLQRTEAPVDTIVIGHLDRTPSEN